jgi:nucleotide-binding universal stress UspA family protein
MNAVTDSEAGIVTATSSVFSRILVGLDGSAESREAARQAARLTETDGRLTLLSVYSIASGLVGGTGIGVPAYYDDDLQREAAVKALQVAREGIPGNVSATAKVVRGCPWEQLIREADRSHDTLVAVGSHDIGRARGIVVGSTTTALVHKAPCSVLVARQAGPGFPRTIVVGVDGSPASALAYASARHLAERTDAELWPVVAHGSKSIDGQRVAAIVDRRHEDLPEEAVPALVAAAVDADLLVVGSRGLHGVRSLGSVSECVAHEAQASVLIVRGATGAAY